MAKKTYLVLRKELAPGESFEASTKPEMASVDSHFDQCQFPEAVVPANPDGPTGVPAKNRQGKKYPEY